MFYVVKSNTLSMRDKIIEGLIKGNEISQEDIYVFDYDEPKILEPALLEYLTLDFEKKTKAVIIKSAEFINLKGIDKHLENRFASAAMLENKNILILCVEKLNKTGSIRKRIEEHATFLEKDSPSKHEISKFIFDFFANRNIKVTNREVELIKSRSSEDFDLLVSELNKLDILQNDGIITVEDIERSTLDFSRERLYKIVEYVATLNVEKIYDMMNQYRAEGESPYLIGEFMVKDFSKLLRYKALINKGFSDGQIQEMTNWNPWALKNYSKWIYHWNDINTLKEFFYDTILQKSFLDMLNNQPEDPIGTLEKILVANVIDIKTRG